MAGKTNTRLLSKPGRTGNMTNGGIVQLCPDPTTGTLDFALGESILHQAGELQAHESIYVDKREARDSLCTQCLWQPLL